MNLIRSAVVQESDKRYIEVQFSTKPGDQQSADQYLNLRIEVSHEGHPRLPEALEEGLRGARDVIDKESARLAALERRP